MVPNSAVYCSARAPYAARTAAARSVFTGPGYALTPVLTCGALNGVSKAPQVRGLPARPPRSVARMPAAPAVPTVRLNSGHDMPLVGFGVYQVRPRETEAVVSAALEAGYRSFDTAAGYANEAAVGRAIAASGIPREELFVTSKMWVQQPDQDPAGAVDSSLEKTGLEYLDLYLVHQPYGDVFAQWRAMEAAHSDGRLRSIGVSNFHPDRLQDLMLHTDVVPAVNQIECHPFFQRAAEQAFHDAHGIVTESWGPLAEGRNGLFTDPVLAAIGEAHGKSVAQVVLRWLVQRGVVVIPKTVRPERMAENLAVLDFTLDDDEVARIAGLESGSSLFLDHRTPEWASKLGAVRVEH